MVTPPTQRRTASGPRRYLSSSLGWSDADTIVVYGQDFPREILGVLDLGGMAFLGLMGRSGTAAEQRVFNSLLVALGWRGQPRGTIVARLACLGAREALQAAVGAGLAVLGTVFVGTIEGS